MYGNQNFFFKHLNILHLFLCDFFSLKAKICASVLIYVLYVTEQECCSEFPYKYVLWKIEIFDFLQISVLSSLYKNLVYKSDRPVQCPYVQHSILYLCFSSPCLPC